MVADSTEQAAPSLDRSTICGVYSTRGLPPCHSCTSAAAQVPHWAAVKYESGLGDHFLGRTGTSECLDRLPWQSGSPHQSTIACDGRRIASNQGTRLKPPEISTPDRHPRTATVA
jgi:hypothetical protein